MTKIKYNNEQIEELKNNINVKNCTAKHIVFTKKFKEKAIKLARNYTYPRDIFEQCGFPKYIVLSIIPQNSIARWKRNIKIKWIIEKSKWQKKKEYLDTSKMNKDEYIEYLEAQLAIVEELKKLDSGKYP